MATKFLVEVHPNYRLQSETGFHHHGAGSPGDPFHVVLRDRALRMTQEFAEHRVELYRKSGLHRARIVDTDGRVIVDWAQPIKELQTTNIHNAHEVFSFRHRGIEIPDMVHNRVLKKFYIKFSTSINPNDSADRSIAADSPAEAIDRFLDNPHTPKFVIDRYRVDETLSQLVPPPADAIPAGTPMISIPAGTSRVVIAVRPGNKR